MTVEHHDLIHEFPEFKEKIHEMKISNNHFKRLFDEYHACTNEVEKMENEVEPVTTNVEEQTKIKRLHLKDELYAMLKQD